MDADQTPEDPYAEVDGLHVNATDKVYRNTATGRVIKVRCKRIPPPPGAGFGMVVVEISGSHCGEDGRALRHGDDGYQIAPAHRCTFQSDQPAEFDRILGAKRREIAAATERAVEVEEAAAALPG